MSSATATAPLTEPEIRQAVDVWFEKLDVHAPTEEMLPLLADDTLEMKFPEDEDPMRGQKAFIDWYEGVTRKFFDEIHVLKSLSLKIDPDGSKATVDLVVNWQAHRWFPPAPKSQWLGYDAGQTWVFRRSPQTGQPIIEVYRVTTFDPMEGSPPL
jgi:hypothetical protein